MEEQDLKIDPNADQETLVGAGTKVTRADYKAIKAFAISQGISVSSVVKRAIKHYMENIAPTMPAVENLATEFTLSEDADPTTVSDFITAILSKVPQSGRNTILVSKLIWELYALWCKEKGVEGVRRQDFNRMVRGLGIEIAPRINGGVSTTHFIGVQFNTNAERKWALAYEMGLSEMIADRKGPEVQADTDDLPVEEQHE